MHQLYRIVHVIVSGWLWPIWTWTQKHHWGWKIPYVAVACRIQKLFSHVFWMHHCIWSAISLNFCMGRPRGRQAGVCVQFNMPEAHNEKQTVHKKHKMMTSFLHGMQPICALSFLAMFTNTKRLHTFSGELRTGSTWKQQRWCRISTAFVT